MDFDIGNLFYVVITLVAIFAGLLGKKKKPGSQGPGGQKKTSQPGFFQSLEDFMRMDEETPQSVDLEEEPGLQHEVEGDEVLTDLSMEPSMETYSEPVPEASTDLMSEYERLLRERNESYMATGSAEMVQNEEPLQLIELEEDDGTDYFEVVKDFNAATAVVYSAIINRLDY